MQSLTLQDYKSENLLFAFYKAHFKMQGPVVCDITMTGKLKPLVRINKQGED